MKKTIKKNQKLQTLNDDLRMKKSLLRGELYFYKNHVRDLIMSNIRLRKENNKFRDGGC